ncbi:hypothetical protein DRQ33_00410 [bacterium]|nr:MAG: hypothetical protein DRQ33_00410 [bacterium]
MGDNIAIISTFVFYLVLLLGIGYWGEKKFGKTYKGFVAAGKGLGAWTSAISAATSGESAWVMLGLAGLGYSKGIPGYWAAIACSLGFIFNSFFITRQLRKATEDPDILTLSDYIEKRTGDRKHILRTIGGIIIIIFMLAYVVGQFTGSGKNMAGMGITTYTGGVLIGAIIIGIYVLMGGYAAVCLTDLVQGILMAVVMIGFPIFAIIKAGGFGAIFSFLNANNIASFIPAEGALGFIIGTLGIALGYPGMPHIVVRYITVRDEREARRSAWIFSIWGIIVFFGSVTLGIVTRVLLPELADKEYALPQFAVNFVHPILAGVVLSAVTAAMMSTADSQLIYSATTLVNDFWIKITKKSVKPRTAVWITRALIGILTIIAMIIALFNIRTIYSFVLYAWSALGSAFGPVVILSLFWKRFNRWGALTSLILGPIITVVWYNVPALKSIVYELIPAFGISLIGAILVTLLTPPAEPIKKYENNMMENDSEPPTVVSPT